MDCYYGPQVNAACASQAYVVPGLLEGQDYLFRVRAENRLGFGPFTTTTEPVRARDPICEGIFNNLLDLTGVLESFKYLMFPSQIHLTPPPS